MQLSIASSAQGTHPYRARFECSGLARLFHVLLQLPCACSVRVSHRCSESVTVCVISVIVCFTVYRQRTCTYPGTRGAPGRRSRAAAARTHAAHPGSRAQRKPRGEAPRGSTNGSKPGAVVARCSFRGRWLVLVDGDDARLPYALLERNLLVDEGAPDNPLPRLLYE